MGYGVSRKTGGNLANLVSEVFLSISSRVKFSREAATGNCKALGEEKPQVSVPANPTLSALVC